MINTRWPLANNFRAKNAVISTPVQNRFTGQQSSVLAPLKSDRVEISKPRFSGRMMQDDKNAQEQLEKEIDELGYKIEKVSRNTRKGAKYGGALGGGMGFLGSLATFASDGFTLTGAGAAGGSGAGGGAARWISKKKYGDPDFNRGLIEEK